MSYNRQREATTSKVPTLPFSLPPMMISNELVSQVFSLPPEQRYALAQQLLDSIDDEEASQFDAQFVAELNRRRDEMLHDKDFFADWRDALSERFRNESA